MMFTNLSGHDWTPEQISGRLKKENGNMQISVEAIYQFIYRKGKKYKLWEFLPRHQRKRKPRSGRNVQISKFKSRIPNAVGIENRSTKANNRTQLGHWETDNMESNKHSKSALSISIDRKTRYSLISKMRNQKSETKRKVLTKEIKLIKSIQKSNKPIVRSVTSDNGSENTKHLEISKEQLLDWFFCNAYHSWEKGSVERTIKEIRRYIPKGTTVNKYTKEQIQWIENRLNNRPMKCLGWSTPAEIMEMETNKYKFRRFQKKKQLATKNLSVALPS